MEKHLTVLGAIFLGNGILGAIGMLVVLAIFSLGSIVTGAASAQDPTVPPGIALIPAGFGFLIAFLIGITTIPSLIVAYGLFQRRRWSKMAALIVGIISLPAFPLGTAAGIYAIWIFLQDETSQHLGT